MPHSWIDIALLIGAAIVIYHSCELFVNGVEWLGHRLAMGQKATGSVLAAFGTALPESVVTLVAVAFGGSAMSRQLGIGAALGGPLALATVAYATVGIVLLIGRKGLPRTPEMRSDLRLLATDQGWFLLIFAAKILLGLVVMAWKPWCGLLFLAAYAAYVRHEIARDPSDEEGEMEPLTFAPRRAVPPIGLAVLQTLLALAVIFAASQLFVGRMAALGPALGLPPQLLALLLSPIATELPETMNAIIWVRQGKIRMALANISGAMMIQTTIPTAFGLFWTPWLLSAPLLLAAGITMLAIGLLIIPFRRGALSAGGLAAVGLLYPVFVFLLVAMHLNR